MKKLIKSKRLMNFLTLLISIYILASIVAKSFNISEWDQGITNVFALTAFSTIVFGLFIKW